MKLSKGKPQVLLHKQSGDLFIIDDAMIIEHIHGFTTISIFNFIRIFDQFIPLGDL